MLRRWLLGGFLLVGLGVALCGCGVGEIKEENERLRAQNERLSAVVDSLRNEPQVLFSRSYDLLESERYEQCVLVLDQLSGKYPDWDRSAVAERRKSAQAELDRIERDQREAAEAEARAKREAEEAKARAERELNRYITSGHDDFQDITFYRTTRDVSKSYDRHRTFEVELYFGHAAAGRKYFRLKTEYLDKRSDYHDTNWIFYEKVHLIDDKGHRLVVETDYPNKKSDNGHYGLKEWSDDPVEPTDVLPFADATSISARFDGKYRIDFELTANQVKAIKEVIAKYRSM